MSSKNKEEILDCIPLLHPYSMDEIYTMLKRHGCKILHEETYNLVEKNLYKIRDKYVRMTEYRSFGNSTSIENIKMSNGCLTCTLTEVSTLEQKIVDKIKFAEKYNIPYEGLIELIKEMNLL